MNYKVSSFIIVFIEVIVISAIIAFVLYPFADKLFNKFEKDKTVNTSNLSIKDKEVLYEKIGVPDDQVIDGIKIDELYSIPRSFGEKGFSYVLKFSILKEEYNMLENRYDRKTEEEVDSENDYYRLRSENTSDTEYICTIHFTSNSDEDNDEVVNLINSKYNSKKILIFIVVFLVIMLINVSSKYRNGFSRQENNMKRKNI